MRRWRRILYCLAVVLAAAGALRAAAGDVFEPDEPAAAPTEAVPAPPPDVTGSSPRPPGVPLEAQEARVQRIVDGDTIWVEVAIAGGAVPVGARHRVRMLEIDAPETVGPDDGVECGGAEATAFARAQLPVGSTIWLEADREDKDRYGRYLRYVWDFEGEFYNEKAVAGGYAKAVLYRPNDRYISRMRQVEASAKQASRGVWGACAVP